MFGWEFPCGENDWTRVTLLEGEAPAAGEVVARGVAVVPTCSGHPLCWGHVWIVALVGLDWLVWDWIGALVALGHCLGWSICWLVVLDALGHCLDWSVGWLGDWLPWGIVWNGVLFGLV
jgi:hypothetical protein